ncbi:hypothetical protein HK102_008242 [Quaeritorhiza haematococci]|nr:hypothetical protein HK102_008242 [Quaeritorhiza haematococci]
MHTTTSKQILEPLAEAVTQLILIISDAEINRTPIPDLSELARVVDDQVVNLVGVGTRIQNQSSADEQLKADMPKACAEVTTASRRLLGATGELVMDAFSKHGRQELLEAVKGILSGTTAVLRAFDDSEVRKILTVSRNLKSKIAKLSSSPSSTSTDPNAAQQIVTLMMQISQTVVTLAQITNKRVGELLQPILQTRLKIAIAGLTKESPLLITATKFVLQKPGSGEALRAREQSCQRVVEACVEIETVVQIKEVGESLIAQAVKDDFGKLSKKLEEQKLKLMAAISNKDPKAAMAALVEYKQVADDLLKLASAIAQQVNDPAQKAQIEILIDAVTKDRDNLEKLTEDLLKNPDDPVLQKRLADQFNHIASTLDALKNALNAALVGEMVTTFGKLSDYQQLSPEPTVLGKLHQAAVNGDKDALANAAEDFGNTNKYLQDLVGSAIKMANDENPEMSQHLKLHANRLDQLAPSVVAAAEGLAANPKDETAKQVHKNVMDMWEDGVKEMQNVTIGQEGVFKTGDIIAGAGKYSV